MLSFILHGGFKVRKSVLFFGLICGGRAPLYVLALTDLYLDSGFDSVILRGLFGTPCVEEIACQC